MDKYILRNRVVCITSFLNKVFDRSNHDLSVINTVFTVGSGAVVIIGAEVNGWFRDRPFALPVVCIFALMLVFLSFYVAASNQKQASSRFFYYVIAAVLSLSFPWFLMRLTGDDLAPKYFSLWIYPISLASWAFTREFSIMLCNILNWKCNEC